MSSGSEPPMSVVTINLVCVCEHTCCIAKNSNNNERAFFLVVNTLNSFDKDNQNTLYTDNYRVILIGFNNASCIAISRYGATVYICVKLLY